jgi:cytochrome c
MSRCRKALLVLAGCLTASVAAAEPLGIGRVVLPEEIAAWDIDVRPDGQGLPAGSGSVADGEAIFAERCAACHGDFAEGLDRWPELSGGHDSLNSVNPVKTVGSYWPYGSTVFDYIKRAMPFGDAQSLSDDEVYALTAFLYHMNDLVDADFVLGNDNFTAIRLPNADGFIDDPRPDTVASAEPCMTDCKASVEITKRAVVLDVTPSNEKNPSASID